jgi:prepilin-type N-terminal cleavage/methylation domain-containing protein
MRRLSQRPWRHRLAGFTLIELLVVLTLLGILSRIAVPAFLVYRDRGRVASVLGSSETVRTALASYAVDSAGHAYPTTIADYPALRRVTTANGGTLPAAPVFSLIAYSSRDTDGDGGADDYSIRLSVHAVQTPRPGGQILVTPGGIYRCGGSQTADCRN